MIESLGKLQTDEASKTNIKILLNGEVWFESDNMKLVSEVMYIANKGLLIMESKPKTTKNGKKRGRPPGSKDSHPKKVFTPEIKEQIIKMITEDGLETGEIAKKLGFFKNSMYSFVYQLRKSGGLPPVEEKSNYGGEKPVVEPDATKEVTPNGDRKNNYSDEFKPKNVVPEDVGSMSDGT